MTGRRKIQRWVVPIFISLAARFPAAAQTDSDLSPTLGASTTNGVVGGTLQISITTSNLGSVSSSNVLVQETLPANLTYVSASIPAGSSYDPVGQVWTISNLYAFTSETLTITASVNSSGSGTESAYISSASPVNTNSQNSASLTIFSRPANANLTLNTSTTTECDAVGVPLTLSVTVDNIGLDTASNILVQEEAPAGLEVLNVAVPPGTSYNAVQSQWTIPSLAPGGVAALELTVEATNAEVVTNIAYLAASSPTNNNTNNVTSQFVMQWMVDSTPPSFACPPNLTFPARNSSGTYIYYAAPVSDNCDPNPAVTYSIPSGTLLPMGHYTNTCVATDASGNSNTCTFNIDVVPAAPIVLSSTVSQGNVTLQWTGNSPPYILQWSPSLTNTNWQGVVDSWVTSVTVPMPAQSAFYRVVLAPNSPDPMAYGTNASAVASTYTSDPVSYWVSNGFPAVSRLSDILQGLGSTNYLGAFDGLESGYSEIRFTNALQDGFLPTNFSAQVNQQLEEGDTYWEALANSIRVTVNELDQALATNPTAAAQYYTTLSNVFTNVFNYTALSNIAPVAAENGTNPVIVAGVDIIEFYGGDNYATNLPPQGPGSGDTNTNVLGTWYTLTNCPTNTSYNSYCGALAAGACAHKLGLVGSNITSQGWNMLSQQIGATGPTTNDAAPMSSISGYFKSNGYYGVVANNLLKQTALQQAQAALQRGCDVLLYYTDGDLAHVEMVNMISISNGTGGLQGAVGTISWGTNAMVQYSNGMAFGKTDASNYGATNNFLAGTNSVEFYIYCKTSTLRNE